MNTLNMTYIGQLANKTVFKRKILLWKKKIIRPMNYMNCFTLLVILLIVLTLKEENSLKM